MAIQGVAIKRHFGIKHFQIATVGDDQRVDFQHLHVFFHEGFEQQPHQRNTLFDLFAGETQFKRDTTAMERLIPGRRINRERQDFFRCFRRNFLNVHAALSGANERDA